jgi:hypothetical protein
MGRFFINYNNILLGIVIRKLVRGIRECEVLSADKKDYENWL